MADCMVCGEETTNCPPSPFLPYSGWRCEKCVKAHLIPYEDLMGILQGVVATNSYSERKQQWIEWWGKDDGYAERYWLPTAEFFGLTIEEAYEASKEWNKQNEFRRI